MKKIIFAILKIIWNNLKEFFCSETGVLNPVYCFIFCFCCIGLIMCIWNIYYTISRRLPFDWTHLVTILGFVGTWVVLYNSDRHAKWKYENKNNNQQ